jgi:hypothetical protein
VAALAKKKLNKLSYFTSLYIAARYIVHKMCQLQHVAAYFGYLKIIDDTIM